MSIIKFEKAAIKYKEIIFNWLNEPHIQEFWDNSNQHRQDIVKFLNGRKEISDYFDGIFSYWIASYQDEPYSLIMTAEVLDDSSIQESWKEHISTTGKTFSLDFCIGNKKYLGQGLAAPTLVAFTKFFQREIDRQADTFFIDPDESNPRAKHVYEKAGFITVGDFIMQGGVFDGQKSYLMIKKLSV